MSLRPELKLDWCSYKAAKFAVEHWHYSRKMPVNKTAKIGVWEGGSFIGAVVYSCGSAGAGASGKKYGLPSTSVAELSRVALGRHVSPVSRIVSISLSMIKNAMPGIRLIVSYADPAQGHIGAIYQAGGWTYVGRSSKDVVYVDGIGKRWHSRTVSESGWKVQCGVKTRCPRPSEMRSVELVPKYKYLMPLDTVTRNAVRMDSKPYPKRAVSIDNDAPATHAGEGGEIPTTALHIQE